MDSAQKASQDNQQSSQSMNSLNFDACSQSSIYKTQKKIKRQNDNYLLTECSKQDKNYRPYNLNKNEKYPKKNLQIKKLSNYQQQFKNIHIMQNIDFENFSFQNNSIKLDLINQQIQDRVQQLSHKEISCQCKKSKCQKNYCVCHENGQLCNPKFCDCKDCENIGQIQVKSIKKIQDYCKCDTKCQKKYCYCFKKGIICTIKCKCGDQCENLDCQVLQQKLQIIQKQEEKLQERHIRKLNFQIL